MQETRLAGVVKNGQIQLNDDIRLPEGVDVCVILQPKEERVIRVRSPRLKDPADAKYFVKKMERIDEDQI